MVLDRRSGDAQAAADERRWLRMAARDAIAFCALIGWYAALVAIGLVLAFAFAFFPELPSPAH